MADHASVASNKPKVELDLHANACVVGDNFKSFMTSVDKLMSTAMI